MDVEGLRGEKTMEPSTTHKTIRRLASLREHRSLLREVFQSALERVLIVSPFVSKFALQADGIPAQVQRATRRGVQVSVYIDNDLNYVDGGLTRSANDGIVELIEAGATVTVLHGVHNKTLIRDNDLITEGSFNWLSAVRTAGAIHQREERTIVVTGDEAKAMIEEEVIGLNNQSGEEMEVKKAPRHFRKIPKLGKFLFGFLIWAIGYSWYDSGIAGLVGMTIVAILVFGWYYSSCGAEYSEDDTEFENQPREKMVERLKRMPKFGKFLFGFLTLMIGYEWYDNGYAGVFLMTIAAMIIFGFYYNNFDAESAEDEIFGSLLFYQQFFKW
jgi:hypothetical protein